MCASQNHVRLLTTPEFLDSIANDHDVPIRWVAIGDCAFGFSPDTVYFGVLSSGEAYYPYYDTALTTIDPYDLPNYHLGHTDDLTQYLRDNAR